MREKYAQTSTTPAPIIAALESVAQSVINQRTTTKNPIQSDFFRDLNFKIFGNEKYCKIRGKKTTRK
jgi:hypothetical protein